MQLREGDAVISCTGPLLQTKVVRIAWTGVESSMRLADHAGRAGPGNNRGLFEDRQCS